MIVFYNGTQKVKIKVYWPSSEFANLDIVRVNKLINALRTMRYRLQRNCPEPKLIEI